MDRSLGECGLDRLVRERTEDLQTKNRMLESLSTKLSKYMAQQVYSSIFAGEQNVEVASKRKKLTVFFSDIVGFLPIRLTPMTATCRVPPLSRVKLGIGWSRGVARDAEQ